MKGGDRNSRLVTLPFRRLFGEILTNFGKLRYILFLVSFFLWFPFYCPSKHQNTTNMCPFFRTVTSIEEAHACMLRRFHRVVNLKTVCPIPNSQNIVLYRVEERAARRANKVSDMLLSVQPRSAKHHAPKGLQPFGKQSIGSKFSASTTLLTHESPFLWWLHIFNHGRNPTRGTKRRCL